jgi:hypothetical protein
MMLARGVFITAPVVGDPGLGKLHFKKGLRGECEKSARKQRAIVKRRRGGGELSVKFIGRTNNRIFTE